MTDNFGYFVGDTIVLTVDKESYVYSTVNVKDNETWKKGTKLVISKVYYDGDVYATKDGVSRMIRKEEFDVVRLDLSKVSIGNVTIHSNVNGELISNHYKRIKLEEDKKKEEEEKMRDEYQKIYGTRYPSYYQLHPDEHPNTYGYDGSYATIKFYEWSNLDSVPRQFTTLKYFLDFLNDNKIEYTVEDKNYLSNMSYAYCTCVRGKARLLISATINGLEALLERFSSNPKSSDPVKWILCKDNNRYTYLKTLTYNGSGDVSSFTFGDARREAHEFDNKEAAEKASSDIKKKTAGFIELIPVGVIADI